MLLFDPPVGVDSEKHYFRVHRPFFILSAVMVSWERSIGVVPSSSLHSEMGNALSGVPGTGSGWFTELFGAGVSFRLMQ